MGSVSLSDRFELLELLREDEVQTFRARERATGRTVEVHLSLSPDRPMKLEHQNVIDQGTYEGKLYVVAAPVDEPALLDSAGAWRIKPPAQPVSDAAPHAPPDAPPKAPPGDFTRMFELRQAPEPVAAAPARPAEPPRSIAAKPGEFTRAFQRPQAAPASAPASSEPGQPGDFTRMFQKPAPPAAMQAEPSQGPVPAPAPPVSQPVETNSPASAGIPRVAIVIAIGVLCAAAVFVLMRTLY